MLGRSSARPKLVHPAGFDSPARAELGVCIAAKQTLEAAHAGLEAAKTKLDDAYYSASPGLLAGSDIAAVVRAAAQQAGKDDQAEVDSAIEWGLANPWTAGPLPGSAAHG